MSSPCRTFHTRRGHILVIILTILITIFASLFIFVTPAGAQDTCLPGQPCSFPLASPGGKCRFNEDLFFTKTDRWVIPPNGYDYFNFRFAPFNSAGGYTDPSGVPGGCVCDVATWINYVLKVNGINTDVTAKYHVAYDIAGVPNDGSQYNKEYFVSIEHNNPKPAPGQNGEASRWDADMRVDNPYDKPLTIRWSLEGNYVTIWIEIDNKTLIAPDFLEQPKTDTLATKYDLFDSFSNTVDAQNIFLNVFGSTQVPNSNTVLLAKYLFAGILCTCLFISIVSKKFRKITLSVFSILGGLATILIFANILLRP